jgi:hypothetical protein
MRIELPIFEQPTITPPIVAVQIVAVMLRSEGIVIVILPLMNVFTVVNLTERGQTFLIFQRQEPVSKVRFLNIAGFGVMEFRIVPRPMS